MVGGSKRGSAADYRIDPAHPPREIDKRMPSVILLHPARPVNPRGGKSVSEPRFRTHRSRAMLAGAFIAFCLTPFAPALAGDSGQIDSFLSTLKRARLIDLSHNWEITSPVAGVNPPYSFALVSTHALVSPDTPGTRGMFGDNNQLSLAAEVMHWSGQHGAPSIDAIGHIGRDGSLFGGVDAAASTSNPDGIGTGIGHVGANLAIDQFPTDLMVNRGILLDVARFVRGDSS